MTAAERLAEIRAQKAASTTPQTKTAAQRLAEIRAAKAAAVAPAPAPRQFGEPTFPAKMGGNETIPGNIARTIGNIPSSAANLARAVVSPFNPFDLESPINIGSNIAKGIDTVKGLSREQNFPQALGNTVLGAGDVLKNVATGAVDLGKKAFNDPSSVVKLGIEDPLLVPSLLYAPGRKAGVDVISAGAKPVTAPANVIGANIARSGERATETARRSFVDDLVSPDRTAKVKKEQVRRSSETGEGVFAKTVVTPSRSEAASAAAVAKIPEVGPGSNQRNYNIIAAENTRLAKKLESDTAANDFAIPRKETISRLNAAKGNLAESPTIVGDAQTTAQRLLDKAIKLINENPGTGSGLLKARKEYDAWVKAQKPKAFDGNTENAFSIANTEIRNTLNDLFDEKAPNLLAKQSRGEQSALFNALENIEIKAAKEADTAFGRLGDKINNFVGTKNKAIQGLAAVAGIGTLGVTATFAMPLAIAAAGAFTIFQGGKLLLKPQVRTYLGNLLKNSGDNLPPDVRNLIEGLLLPNAPIEELLKAWVETQPNPQNPEGRLSGQPTSTGTTGLPVQQKMSSLDANVPQASGNASLLGDAF